MMWLTQLKVALIEKDTDALGKLIDDIPQLSDIKKIEEAAYLTKEAALLLQELKEETAASMEQIQKNLQFLRSTERPSSRLLDITS